MNRFVKQSEELNQYREILSANEFSGMEMLTIPFETTPDFVREVLPPPLEYHEPTGYAFVGRFRTSNSVGPLAGGGVYVACRFNGEPGHYCLSMPMDNEAAVVLGREYFGEPKKLAKFHFETEGNKVRGWCERRGVRFLELQADLNQDLPLTPMTRLHFHYKYSPQASGQPGFDLNPVLIRHESRRTVTKNQMGTGDLIFRESNFDPIADIPLVKTGPALYIEGQINITPRKVADVDPEAYWPYAHVRYEPWPQMAWQKELPS